jgi:sugar phosphate isomerase/epimerase
MIEKLDLEVCSVGTSPIGVQDKLLLTDPRREVRDEAINRAKKAIDFAALFGADVNVGKFRGNIPADNRITGWNWLREGFETMCEYAQRKNIMVSVEPQERGNLNTLNTTQEAVQWIETVNIQNLGLLLDTYHMSFERQSLSTSFVDGAKHLRHVHIADTGRLGPGQGSIDFMEVVKILKGIGYKGYLSLETAQKPEGYAITAQSWKYMDYLCNQLL